MSATDGFSDGVPESIPPVDPGYGDDSLTNEQKSAEHESGGGGIVSPGSTATGAGEAELGTTEADVSDGREQKQPRVD
jgi:hypothetical protein